MNSRSGSGSAPSAMNHSLNSPHSGRCTRSYSSPNSAQPRPAPGAAAGAPSPAGAAARASPAGVAGQSGAARFGEVDQVLGESKRLELALPGCLGGEDDPVPAAAEHVADPDAVVGGPVGALRHEQDGQGPHVAAPGETDNQEVRHSREASEHTGKTARCRPTRTFVPRLRRRPE